MTPEAMPKDQWEALDEPAPTPSATPVLSAAMPKDEWDALDVPTSTPMPKDDWDALDANPTPATPTPQPSYRPTADFSDVDVGGSAYTPSGTPVRAPAEPIATPVPEDFYSTAAAERAPDPSLEALKYADDPAKFLAALLRNEQAKIPNATKAAPYALPVIASLAAPEHLAWQTGASLVGGAAGRYAAGEPILDKKAMLMDLLAPIGVNTAIGVGKELATPLLKYANPAAYEAIHDIRKGWKNLGTVTHTGAVPQDLGPKDIIQKGVDFSKDVLGSPIQRGFKSKVQELRDVANRVGEYAKGRNRISEYIDRRGREIFMQPAEGIRGRLGRQDVIPLSDREDMKLLLEGHKTIDQVSPLAAERAPLLKKFYEEFGELGQEFGIINRESPMVRARYGTPDPLYTGPNISKETGLDTTGLLDMTKMRHEGKKTVGFHERVDKYFDPDLHVADALEGFNAYKKFAPDQFASAYAFGAPGDYARLSEAAEGFGRRQLAPGASVAKSTARLVEERLPGATVAEGGTKAFGRDVNELLNRAMASDLPADERATLESLIGSVKQIYHTGERSVGANLTGKALGTTLLPLSWLNQYGQQAWNVAKPGLQANVRGLVRYARDPDFRALIQASGGRGSSMEHLFNEVKGDESVMRLLGRAASERLPTRLSEPLGRGASRIAGSRLGQGVSNLAAYLPENLVGKSIGWSEGMLRGPLGAGHYVHAEDLWQRALDAAASGTRFSRGLSRELREAGWNDEMFKDLPEMSAHDLRNAGATLTGRYQLMSGDPGHTSARLIGSPWGRIAAQFKAFPLGAARLARSDLYEPIKSGLLNRDMSELSLGVGRLARLAAAGYGSQLAVEAGKGLFKGQSPADWATNEAPTRAAKTILGSFADIPIDMFSEGGGVWKAAKNQLPPVFSIGDQPTKTELSLLLANALVPKAGAVATMLSPAWKEFLRDKPNAQERINRRIAEMEKRLQRR
jgi:hypothetical protein